MGKKNGQKAKDTGMSALMNHLDDLQDEALVIESLLSTAMSMSATRDRQDSMTIIEMASERIARLKSALDIVNRPQVTT